MAEFRVKLEVFQLVYRDDRNKNLETMAELSISSAERTKVVKSIAVEDYSEGPIPDVLNQGGEMWVFGKMVKGRERFILRYLSDILGVRLYAYRSICQSIL